MSLSCCDYFFHPSTLFWPCFGVMHCLSVERHWDTSNSKNVNSVPVLSHSFGICSTLLPIWSPPKGLGHFICKGIPLFYGHQGAGDVFRFACSFLCIADVPSCNFSLWCQTMLYINCLDKACQMSIHLIALFKDKICSKWQSWF